MPDRPSSTSEEWNRFEEHERDHRVRNYRVCCLVAAFFMPAGSLLDVIDFGTAGFWDFLPARLLSASALLIFWALLALPVTVGWIEVMGLLIAVPPIAAIAWMIAKTGGAASPYYAGLNLVTLGAGLLMRWRTRDSIVVSLLTILAFIAASLAVGEIRDWRSVGNNLYFLIVNGFIVVVGTWLYVGIRFSEFQTNQQLAQSREKLAAANVKLGTQNDQLRKLDEMKSNFFANISHELRTPLTLIEPSVHNLLTHGHRLTEEARRQQLQRIQVNTSKLLRLISDLLDLAKMEAGKLTVVLRPTNVRDLIAELETSLRGATEAKGIEFTVRVGTEIQWAEIDPEKIGRVCLNLLSNALKFTPDGGQIHFNVSVRDGELCLEVRDSGPGLRPGDLDHVFDRFWQADDSSSRQHQGTGIGLSLVREFTQAHGGHVHVESLLGSGATFRACIPWKPCSPATSSPPPPTHGIAPTPLGDHPGDSAKERARVPTNPNGESRPRVMIAEDNDGIRDLLREELQADFDTVTFPDGDSMIAAARFSPPDVVITDMMMPRKNGLDVCRQLRAEEATGSTPIIVLTARSDDETRMACLDAGATDFLTKPFAPTELRVRLRNLATLNEHRKALQTEKSRLESTLVKLQETEALLMRNEKLAALGTMSAGLIHEINNPLNYARQGLLLLRQHAANMTGAEAEECRETLDDALGGVDRVVRIISDLRNFTRPGQRLDEPVSLKNAVETTLRFFSHQWPSNLELRTQVSEKAVILGSSGLLVQVMVNLIQNALDSMAEKTYPPGQHPTLTIHGAVQDETAVLDFRDNGVGIPADRLSSIFNPFYTTKDVGQGLGLGLAISHRIVTDHKGSIHVISEPGQDCAFRLEFPVAGKEVSV